MSGHILRPKIQDGGQVHVRQAEQIQVSDIEQEPMKYIALALVHLRNALGKLPKMIEDNSRPVDEYRTQSNVADSIVTLNLQPQFEQTELIRAILITGPAGLCTLQLGQRFWNLTIPTSGFILISPIWLQIGRDEPRILTGNAAGGYTLELMGHVDERATP